MGNNGEPDPLLQDATTQVQGWVQPSVQATEGLVRLQLKIGHVRARPQCLLSATSRHSLASRNRAPVILKAMVAVAGADGRLNAREVELIQKVYQDQTGRSGAHDDIANAVAGALVTTYKEPQVKSFNRKLHYQPSGIV